MKIHKLIIKNLNSLKGEWRIDFTDPSYKDDGLFAIVGPTGAGKTTILDAICLSLYGRTPRLDSISNSSNEIMNRVSTECFAQTTFSCDEGVFRSSFEQHYSSSKRGSNLQPPKMELANDVTNEILANSKSQVPLKVGKLIGLNYEQFTRAVLLAQGQFKKFLEADANDRSALLETITGTQIYSDISIKVFERAKEENLKLTALNHTLSDIKLLTEEQQKELENQSNEIDAQTKKLKNEIQELGKQIKWINELKKLKDDSELLEQKLAKNREEISQFESQSNQLLRDKRAQIIVEDYRIKKHSKESLDNLDSKIVGDERKIDNLKNEIAKLDKDVAQAETLANAAQKELDDQKPTIDNVKRLDTIIAEKKKDIEPEQNNLKQLQSQFSQACRKAKISPDDLADDLTSEIIELQIKEVLYGKSISDIRQILNDFNELKILWKEALAVKKEIDNNNASIKKFQNDLQQYSQTIEKQNKEKQRLESELKIAEDLYKSLEKNIAFSNLCMSLEKMRSRLVDNEPCPLCGATSHPFCKDLPPITLTEDEKKQKDTSAQIRDLQGKLSEAGNEITKAETQIVQANRFIDELNKKNESLQKQSDDICENKIGCDKDVSVKEAESRIQLISNKTAETQNKLKKAEALDAQKEPVHFREAFNKQKLAINKKEGALNELINQRQELFGTDDPDMKYQQLSAALNDARKKLQQYKETIVSKNTELTSTKHNLDALQEERKTASKQYDEALEKFNKKLEEQQFTSEKDFLDSRLTDDQRENYQKRQKELDEQKTRLEERKIANNEALNKLEEQNLTDKSEEELNRQFSQLNAVHDELNRQFGVNKEKLDANAQRKKQHSEIQAQFLQQKTVADNWSYLNKLIGSADGKTYRKMVQRMSLEILIDYANEQMSILAPRYQLTLPQKVSNNANSENNSETIKSTPANGKEDMKIFCIDAWQGNAIRPTDNLSGGESFLVSLALALGLSKMSSQNQSMNTLFLDEGFGTLDDETLQTALDAINKFQYSDDTNKLVGIISHVDALKERINNKIEVARSSAGVSSISGPGVTKSY